MEKVLDWAASKTLWILLVPAFIVFSFTLAVPVYLSIVSDKSWKIGYDINGAIGDFFGGVMNPIIALMALVWLVKAVRLQQRELEHTRIALQASEKHQAAQVKISAMTALIASINSEQTRLSSELNEILPELNKLLAEHHSEQEQMEPGHILSLDGYACSVLDKKNELEESLEEREKQKLDYFGYLKSVIHLADESSS